MHTQEDLVQQRGTTGVQKKPPSEAVGSSSLRRSFLALYDLLISLEGLEIGDDVQPWTKSRGMALSMVLR